MKRHSYPARIAGLLTVTMTAGLLAVIPSAAISGGTPVSDGTYRFTTKIDFGRSRGCTGALIAPQWVVTASACFTDGPQPPAAGPPSKPTTATVGRTTLSGTAGYVMAVVELVPRIDRNLVLAKLATPIADIGPLPIATNAPVVGEVLRVAGYGRTATEWAPDRLHAAGYTVQTVGDTSLDITATAGVADPCKGDTGGPAFREINGSVELVAITSTSWQHGCLEVTETRQGAVETRVDNLRAWIQQEVTPDPTLSRAGWTVTADSQQSGLPVSNVLDGNPATLWHTQYDPTVAPLPHAITVDMHTTNLVSGLRYLPRNDHPNGRIGNYQVHLSTDGTTWGNPVTAGTFADDATEKAIAFIPTTGRFVRLTALTEAGDRGPFSSAAELNLTGKPVPRLSRAGWTVTADSQQPGLPVSNVLDGNPATLWHTQYDPTVAPLPHSVTIDMHSTNVVSGVDYLPRNDHPNGRIGNYQIHVSTDGTTWGSSVATGTFADDATEKNLAFTSTMARFVRLTALTEAGDRAPFSSAAELNLTGKPVPRLSRAGWTVTADSQQSGSGGFPVTNVLDGNPGTLWHTQYDPTVAPLPHSVTIDMHTTNLVSGLHCLPRNDHPNGRIGNYQIHVSTDGTTWGSPVATGTFADDTIEKAIAFTPKTGRFLRLTALTEAGNRAPFSSAAELNLTGSTP